MKKPEFKGKAAPGLLSGLLLALVLSFVPRISLAGGLPEYMQLKFDSLKAVEIKGDWDDDAGVFICTDIEELPQERRPKLRGILQAVNKEKLIITLYGLNLEIDDKTQFLDSGPEKFSINDLKVGDWIEVTCSVGEDGEWEAKKIKMKNIKKGNKIKSVITRYHIDGEAPDTLEIYGLKVILTKETDVNYPGSSFEDIELDLFEDLSLSDPAYCDQGIPAGDHLLIGGEFRQNVEYEGEYDLSDNIKSNQKDARPEIRLELSGYLNGHFRAFAQARIREMVYLDSERSNPPGRNLNSDITQLYILMKDIGLRGLAASLGRQDLDEDREWLFDEYLDMARIYYYGFQPFVFDFAYIHSNVQLKDKFKTWTDFLLQVKYRFNKRSAIRAYFLSRKDTNSIRNREPVYYGLGYTGRVGQYLRPWAEFSILRGEDKGKNLEASAMDIGMTAIAFNIKYAPSVTVGYAGGTGDKSGTDAVSNEFRQTGYQDNVGYFGGVRTLHYYGEVVDPELSNIKIWTLGTGFRPRENASLEIIYHIYKQDRLDNKKVRGNLRYPPPIPNGVSDDLGWGLDFALGLANLWDRASFVWTFGLFKPGDAYPSFGTPNNIATSNKANLKIDL